MTHTPPPATRTTVIRRAVVVAALVIVPALALTATLRSTRTAQERRGVDKAGSASDKGARVERGRYLVAILACGDCHTPLTMGAAGPEPDMTRFLAGHPESFKTPPPPPAGDAWMWSGSVTNTAFAGPWGVSYTANLTPDRNTGLGAWTEDTFVAAIRTGRHMGVSREIAPPMPWMAYKSATDEDLKAVFAYLRTIPPVVNHVPDYAPPAAAPAGTP
jgi:mono/diheme cytochrome c family protein